MLALCTTYVYCQGKCIATQPYAGLPSSTMVQVMPTRRSQVQECESANLHMRTRELKTVHLFNEDNNIRTLLLYYCTRKKSTNKYKKTFSKNVEGCRGGSAKNCPGKTEYTRTTQVANPILTSSATLPSHLTP